MTDRSYYDECRVFVQGCRKNHMRRFWLLCAALLYNVFTHVLMFGVKYAGPSLTAFYASQPKESRDIGRTAGSFGAGILGALIAVALVIFGIRSSNPKRRKILVALSGVTLLIIGLSGRSYQSQNLQDNGVHISYLPFGMGVMAVIFSIALLVLALFGEATRPKLVTAFFVVLVLAAAGDFISIPTALIILVIYAALIRDTHKMKTVMNLPGYPYFNERFDEMQEHNEYEPLHPLDSRTAAEMPDTSDNGFAAPQAAPLPPKPQRPRPSQPEPTMDYTLAAGTAPDEMPGIEDIFEKAEPLPEPELPRADEWDIPAPQPSFSDTDAGDTDEHSGSGWNIPAPDWNMPEPSWDVPEINTDIPDLPEIPDIPKI